MSTRPEPVTFSTSVNGVSLTTLTISPGSAPAAHDHDHDHGHESSLVPVVLVHGFTGSSLDWADVLPALGEHHHVIAYDHRGHGDSTNTGDASTYNLEQLVDDLAGVVAALGLKRFHLLGHSMGGFVAMRYALRAPETVASLILMDTSAEALPGISQYFGEAKRMAAEQGMDALFAVAEQFLPTDERGRELAERMRRKYHTMDPVAFVALADELGSTHSVLDRLSELTMPVTIFVGENDAPFVSPSAAMTAVIPGAEQVTFAGAGHCPQEDDPAGWTEALLESLRRAARPR